MSREREREKITLKKQCHHHSGSVRLKIMFLDKWTLHKMMIITSWRILQPWRAANRNWAVLVDYCANYRRDSSSVCCREPQAEPPLSPLSSFSFRHQHWRWNFCKKRKGLFVCEQQNSVLLPAKPPRSLLLCCVEHTFVDFGSNETWIRILAHQSEYVLFCLYQIIWME